jgi:hypothetical protein
MISPTITDPLVQWAENKDWAGRKLRPDGNVFAEKPSSQMYWGTVREPSRLFTEWLNKQTGGDEVRPGWGDVSPEAVDLIIDTFTGGAGRFMSDIVSTPIKAIKGESVETYEIPFARKVYGKLGKAATTQDYYENMDSVRLVKRQLKHYADDDEKTKEILKDYGQEADLIRLSDRIEKRMTKLRKAKKEAKENGEDTKSIESDMEELMKDFNKEYNSSVK